MSPALALTGGFGAAAATRLNVAAWSLVLLAGLWGCGENSARTPVVAASAKSGTPAARWPSVEPAPATHRGPPDTAVADAPPAHRLVEVSEPTELESSDPAPAVAFAEATPPTSADLVAHIRQLPQRPGAAQRGVRLAWLLATHADPAVRDADLAILIGQCLVRADATRAAHWEVLAAAFAGDAAFPQAVQAAEAALALAGDDATGRRAQSHLTLYRRGLPLRDAVTPPIFVPRHRTERLAHAHLLVGRQLHAEHDTESAIAAWHDALRLVPHLQPGHADLASVMLHAGRFEAAEAHAQQSLAQVPDDPAMLAVLAVVRLRQDRAAEAKQLYQQALTLRPDWLQLANDLAWLLATHADPAVRDPQRAVQLAETLCADPQNHTARTLDTLAAAYAAAGRYREALQCAQRAVACADAPQVDGLTQRVRLYEARSPVWNRPRWAVAAARQAVAQQRLDEAVGVLEAALRDSAVPDAEVLAWLGMLHLERGNVLQTIHCYNAALAARPDCWQIANELAWLYATHHDPWIRSPAIAVEMARVLCEKTNHADAKCLDTLAAAYAASGRFDDAVAALRRALPVAGDAAMRADLQRRLQLYEARLAVFDQRGMRMALARLAAEQGNLDQAATLVQETLHQPLGAEHAEALALLGTIRLHQDRAADAVEHFGQALALAGQWVELANDLAWLLATHPDPAVRDGPRAVRLAEELLATEGLRQPKLQDTFAAALAEQGRYDEAARVVARALDMLASDSAAATASSALHRGLEHRRRLYLAGKPYRQAPSSGRKTPPAAAALHRATLYRPMN